MNERDYKKLHYLIDIAYIAVFLLIAYFVFRYIFGAIMPFLIAFIAASIVEPIVKRLTERLRFPRSLASTLCILLLLLLVAGIGFFLSSSIWAEIKALIANVPQYLKSMLEYLKELTARKDGIYFYIPDDLIQKASDYISDYDYSSLLTGSLGSYALGYAKNVVVSIPNILVFILVTIISGVFMSSAFPKVKSFILRQFKEPHQELLKEIQKSLFSILRQYFRSYILLMTLTFTELLIFFLIFNFKPAFSLALIIAIVDILPVLGVGTVLIPWALFSLLSGAPWRALILICMYIVITVVRQILEPKVIGDHVGMLPIVTLFCIWVGLKLFGFGGMFLVPITVAILKNLHDSGTIQIWKNEKQKIVEKEEKDQNHG